MLYLPRDTSCVLYFSYTQGALNGILYFLVVWLGEIFSSTQITVIFGDPDINKCLYNIFLVIEQTNRISLAI